MLAMTLALDFQVVGRGSMLNFTGAALFSFSTMLVVFITTAAVADGLQATQVGRRPSHLQLPEGPAAAENLKQVTGVADPLTWTSFRKLKTLDAATGDIHLGRDWSGIYQLGDGQTVVVELAEVGLGFVTELDYMFH